MRNNEQGRSMIEMLGVLAIVGVLSVGGIAGYSKAMSKFKTNKLMDQINMITTNVRTLYASQRSYDGLDSTLAKKVNLIPSEMYSDVSTSEITNAFGGKLTIEVNDGYVAGDNKAFTIEIDNIPSTACIAMVTNDWGSESDAGLVVLAAATGATAPDVDEIYNGATPADLSAGAYGIPGNDDNPIPFNVTNSNEACGTNTTASIVWKYL